MLENPEIAILADGLPPVHPVPLGLFMTADVLVCCDGACGKARALGRMPDYAVGDGDSISAEDKTALGERFVAVADQDTNDLAKAFHFASKFNPRRIVILGATGRREDHALGNIFRLFDFVAEFTHVSMLTDSGIFEVVVEDRTFACRPGEAVSIFATDCRTRIHSEGLVWPLDAVRLENLYCATLNRTSGTSFRIVPTFPVLLFRTYPCQ